MLYWNSTSLLFAAGMCLRLTWTLAWTAWGPEVCTGDRRTKMTTSLRRAGAWSLEKGRTRWHRSQGAERWQSSGLVAFFSGVGLLRVPCWPALLSLLSASRADLSLVWSEEHILWGQLPPGSEGCPV